MWLVGAWSHDYWYPFPIRVCFRVNSKSTFPFPKVPISSLNEGVSSVSSPDLSITCLDADDAKCSDMTQGDKCQLTTVSANDTCILPDTCLLPDVARVQVTSNPQDVDTDTNEVRGEDNQYTKTLVFGVWNITVSCLCFEVSTWVRANDVSKS